MELQAWPEYMPPPGSRYILHYVPEKEAPDVPDVASLTRALDARPGVAVKSLDREGDAGIRADVITYVGDASLLQILGRYLCAGECYLIDSVERIDDGGLGGVSVTIGRVTDAILDPIQDIGSAAAETTRETVATARRVGLPSLGIVAVAVVAFLVAREL